MIWPKRLNNLSVANFICAIRFASLAYCYFCNAYNSNLFSCIWHNQILSELNAKRSTKSTLQRNHHEIMKVERFDRKWAISLRDSNKRQKIEIISFLWCEFKLQNYLNLRCGCLKIQIWTFQHIKCVVEKRFFIFLHLLLQCQIETVDI